MSDLHDGNRLLQVAEGLQILAPHGDNFDLAAEHDIIYAGATLPYPEDEEDKDEEVDEEDADDNPRDSRLTEAEQQRLVDLGWFVDRETRSWAFFP